MKSTTKANNFYNTPFELELVTLSDSQKPIKSDSNSINFACIYIKGQ